MGRILQRNNTLAVSALALLIGGVQPASAEDFYAWIGGIVGITTSNTVGTLNNGAAVLGVGYSVNKYFDVEAEIATPSSSDSFTDSGVDFSYKADYGIAAYAKFNLPINDNLTVFTRIGYAKGKGTTSYTISGVDYSVSETRDGLAYGIGGEWDFTPSSGFRVDITGYDVYSETDNRSVSAAYVRRW